MQQATAVFPLRSAAESKNVPQNSMLENKHENSPSRVLAIGYCLSPVGYW